MPGSCWRERHLAMGLAPALHENRERALPSSGREQRVFGVPPGWEGGRNVGQRLAAGKSDVIAPGQGWGCNERQRERERGRCWSPAGRRDPGLAPLQGQTHQDFRDPSDMGHMGGSGESPEPWWFLVTGPLCLVSPQLAAGPCVITRRANGEWTCVFSTP